MDFTLLMAWIAAVAAGIVIGYGAGSHREQQKCTLMLREMHLRNVQLDASLNKKDNGPAAAEYLAHHDRLKNLPEVSYNFTEEENHDD